ncbi:hypothetical protein AK830_g4386 [Neonectria ditissima]|uniref:Uncharacterized protein n=1 Tax=Neonectria ditissima TaxID=78410 RepID=A0A0P7BNS9_9HYPO|nr:hypothetical protein AK830_g4386 [Neonectria ditissima]
MASFTLAAGPDTDLWKKPPSWVVSTAPSRSHSSGPATSFSSASVTFTTTYVQQYDQAGILLALTHPTAGRKWIKAGIEFYNGTARLSVVACDAWADWSVASAEHAEEIVSGARPVTIAVEKDSSNLGSSLWIYVVDGEAKTPLREICWVYGKDKGEDWDLEVSALVARPGKELDTELEVKFKDFDVKWAK